LTLSLALALGATACDDNPVDEGVDEAARLEVNPAVGTVDAGGEILVSARVLNQYGAPTYEAVTAEPCSGLVTVVTDSLRLEFEPPERFRVRAGAAKGSSCVRVRGGGFEEEVPIRIVPAALRILGKGAGVLDTIGSGGSFQYPVQFLTKTGAQATGFGLADLHFESTDTLVGVVNAQGQFTARAPGVTTIIVTGAPTLGATREITRRVLVEPGVFSGTAAQVTQTGSGAALLALTQGAVPFDADMVVEATIAGQALQAVLPATGNTRSLLIPFGTPAGTTINYTLSAMGPNQVAVAGSFVTTAAAPDEDTWEGSDDPFAAPLVPAGTTVVGTIGDTGSEELYRVQVTEAGTYRYTVWWNSGSDIDAYLADGDYTAYLLARETSAMPETGTIVLQPGIYIMDLYMYESVVPSQTFTAVLVKQ
jgi:hypothetical protein